MAGYLHRELKTALDCEDYERAAVLRDRIAAIDRGVVPFQATGPSLTAGAGEADSGRAAESGFPSSSEP